MNPKWCYWRLPATESRPSAAAVFAYKSANNGLVTSEEADKWLFERPGVDLEADPKTNTIRVRAVKTLEFTLEPEPEPLTDRVIATREMPDTLEELRDWCRMVAAMNCPS